MRRLSLATWRIKKLLNMKALHARTKKILQRNNRYSLSMWLIITQIASLMDPHFPYNFSNNNNLAPRFKNRRKKRIRKSLTVLCDSIFRHRFVSTIKTSIRFNPTDKPKILLLTVHETIRYPHSRTKAYPQAKQHQPTILLNQQSLGPANIVSRTVNLPSARSVGITLAKFYSQKRPNIWIGTRDELDLQRIYKEVLKMMMSRKR